MTPQLTDVFWNPPPEIAVWTKLGGLDFSWSVRPEDDQITLHNDQGEPIINCKFANGVWWHYNDGKQQVTEQWLLDSLPVVLKAAHSLRMMPESPSVTQ